MAPIVRAQPIRLTCTKKGSQVLVEPADRDLFMMRMDEAIKACRIYVERVKSFEDQLDELLNHLGGWIVRHQDKIHKAFLTLQDARLLFLVVLKGQVYDCKLEDELADLDIAVAQDESYSEITLDAQALPLCDDNGYLSFCNPGWIMEYSLPDAK